MNGLMSMRFRDNFLPLILLIGHCVWPDAFENLHDSELEQDHWDPVFSGLLSS